MNGGVDIGRVLQLYDTQRHAIDKKQHIRPPSLTLPVIDVLHSQLIHHTENIILRHFEIDQRHHDRQSLLRCELDAIHHPLVYLVQGGEITLTTGKTDRVVELLDFFRQQLRTSLFDKGFEIRFDQDIAVSA